MDDMHRLILNKSEILGYFLLINLYVKVEGCMYVALPLDQYDSLLK